MTDLDIAGARSSARSIVRRLVGEPAFAEHLRANPHATLLDAGLPDWAVDDFVTHDLGIEPDVSGYALSECRVTSLLWVEGDGVDAQ